MFRILFLNTSALNRLEEKKVTQPRTQCIAFHTILRRIYPIILELCFMSITHVFLSGRDPYLCCYGSHMYVALDVCKMNCRIVEQWLCCDFHYIYLLNGQLRER